ncbi:arginine--tRNA ligase [Glycomyces sp. TRM65418]|uniref:arginine--tRNA ligase n=1 Tax=Glycomyces sp. TRM65418 TaxID=2867006 RepID=UPI001CE51C24|nr:arginine--tRNA ligase [Glycomyces sp. TRM65418]MCC3764992.1 arginine--tRNA ligase [Glycomyces sp. TRM65418]QZD54625.1 arginine--tRNA ligase [Glycomyces sp. TRM65418]
MTPETLAEKVLSATRAAFEALGLDAAVLPARTAVERPRDPKHGDYASNIALQTAKKAGTNPRALAEKIAELLAGQGGVAKVDIAGPGFLNITVDAAAAGGIAGTIVAAGASYGTNNSMEGVYANLEFVSANPTGPIHAGGTRWAAMGDSLARVMRASGAKLIAEYYVNDAGTQVDHFAASLLARAKGEPTPENGYVGAYIDEIAADVLKRRPDALDAADPLEVFRTVGLELMLDDIKGTLADFGTHFDVFFSERSLHERGELDKAVERLGELGHVYEADGAVWLRTTDFGDDKDRVLKNSRGGWTYFAADCAYYLDKRERGFEKLVFMLGADHHGYVGRMQAISQAFGDEPGTMEILIGQFVNLLRDGEPVRLSKRAGNIITLNDVVEAVGVDAARYALTRYSADSAIDLDIELWTRHGNENPVYYVQYAHARTSAVLRNAADRGVAKGESYDASLLAHPRESDLLKALAEFPSVVASAAELREPHRVARYAEELAAAYHRFQHDCRVLPVGDEAPTDLNRARLWVVDATRVVLANALGLLGVSAPERM